MTASKSFAPKELSLAAREPVNVLLMALETLKKEWVTF